MEWHWNTSIHPTRYIIHSCFNVNSKLVLEEVKNLENVAIWESHRASKYESFQGGEGGDFAKIQLVALQPLARGTAVTVNYNSFEWEMSTPFMDSEVPSEYENSVNKESTSTENEPIYESKLENSARGKGRVVRGYKYIQQDEKKFLIDNGLLLKHIQEKEIKIVNA